MKKRFFACAIVAIMLSLFVNSTLAYFTASGTARNVITTGKVEVRVVEQQRNEDGSCGAFENRVGVMPGAEISKIARAQVEEGAAASFVRMKYEITIFDAAGEQMPHTAGELEKIITIDTASEYWTEQEGWWYYDAPLADGEMTEPLFEQVVFSGPNMTNAYQNATIYIDVVAQAVQQAHNGPTALEALGWPEA